jgi:hypothetical protein
VTRKPLWLHLSYMTFQKAKALLTSCKRCVHVGYILTSKFNCTISHAFFGLLLSTYSQCTVFYLIFHFGFNSDELCVQCKFCDKVGNITVIGGRDKPYTLEDSESGKFVPIGCFDCRGIECIEFSFRDGWAAEGVRFPSLISDVPSTLSKVVYHTHIIHFYSNVTSLI